MQAFNVYLRGKLIDTVFDESYFPNDVRQSLINHDGYNHNIKVTAERITFEKREAQAKASGFYLERDKRGDHPYCLWFNSPTGSKEIWIKNLKEEFDRAFAELKEIQYRENNIQTPELY